MDAATISELKNELKTKKQEELIEACLRLAKFRKENKELLTYLLFEAEDEGQYIRTIKEEIDRLFDEINTNHAYYIKKSARKILRLINKFSRYSGIRRTEAELNLHFCRRLKETSLPGEPGPALANLYKRQIDKLQKLIRGLHEDLQFDYGRELEKLGKEL